MKLNKDFIYEILQFLEDEGELPNLRGNELSIMVDVNAHTNDVFSVGFQPTVSNNLYMGIPEYYSDTKCMKLLFKNVKRIHKFNINKFARKHKISTEMSHVLFNILHEVGHMIDYIKYFNAHFDKTSEEYFNAQQYNYTHTKAWYSKFIPHDKIIHYQYRIIDNEYRADLIAIRLLTEYIDDLKFIAENKN